MSRRRTMVRYYYDIITNITDNSYSALYTYDQYNENYVGYIGYEPTYKLNLNTDINTNDNNNLSLDWMVYIESNFNPLTTGTLSSSYNGSGTSVYLLINDINLQQRNIFYAKYIVNKNSYQKIVPEGYLKFTCYYNQLLMEDYYHNKQKTISLL